MEVEISAKKQQQLNFKRQKLAFVSFLFREEAGKSTVKSHHNKK